MLKAVVFSVQLIVLAPMAGAQSIPNELKDFGLLGTWARDCDRTPGPQNDYLTFSTPSHGEVRLVNDFGPYYDDMIYRIIDARAAGDNKLALRQVLSTDDQVVLDVIMLKDGDKIRLWSSRSTDGAELVTDGLVASTDHRETHWLEHCQGRRADGGPMEFVAP